MVLYPDMCNSKSIYSQTSHIWEVWDPRRVSVIWKTCCSEIGHGTVAIIDLLFQFSEFFHEKIRTVHVGSNFSDQIIDYLLITHTLHSCIY